MKGKDLLILVLVFLLVLVFALFVFVRVLRLNFLFGNTIYVKIDKPIDDNEIPKLAQWIYKVIDSDKANRIKAVFVEINSPGGSAASSEEMYQALKYAKSKGKKVIAYIHSIGASGGYYIASVADKIVAIPPP